MPGFPKSARLLKSDEYRAVLSDSDFNVSNGPLRLRARKNRMRSARLGLVVTKRGTPLAHRRNRLKRLIREEFRTQHSVLAGIDVVVQVFGTVSDARLTEWLREQLNEANVRLMVDENIG